MTRTDAECKKPLCLGVRILFRYSIASNLNIRV